MDARMYLVGCASLQDDVSPLTSNLYLHIFTGKFVRFPPFSNIHVGNLKSPRGYFSFSTWRRIISSEVSFHSSEVSFHSSEEFFILHVDISKSPRGNHFSPTEPRIDMYPTLNYCCVPTSTRRASVVSKREG